MRPIRELRRLLHGLLPLACCATLAAQVPPYPPEKRSAPDEKFERTDPYTRGQAEELARAGYVTLEPAAFADGITPLDMREALGCEQMLWVETAHFKLASTLATARCANDKAAEQRQRTELARLAKRIARVPRDPTRLDPWLRLHLYALRLEELYADFQARFGLRDEDFPAKGADLRTEGPSMGSGPYLGQEAKFTVLLAERHSQAVRFGKRWLEREDASFYRGVLPGGSWYFGTSAETVKELGSELDDALHALVASEVAYNLCEGFRGSNRGLPLWFKHGLALVYGRLADEHWNIYVPRESPGPEDTTWRWEPRLNGLVSNGFVATWEEMLDWKDRSKLEARHHMTAWSRVGWLLGLEKVDRRAFLMTLSEPADPYLPEGQQPPSDLERQALALNAAFGKSPGELDTTWRKWVLKKYPKR